MFTYKSSSTLVLLSLLVPCNSGLAMAGTALPLFQTVQDQLTKHKQSVLTLAGIAGTAALVHQLYATDYNAIGFDKPDYYWDWNSIDTSNITFADDFLFGVGTSAYQTEGDCYNTDWYDWEQQKDDRGNARVKHVCGLACDHWRKYKEDVAIIKHIGAGIYRLSLAWDKIQPDEDRFDQEAIDHYKDVVKELHSQGIKVLIGFHHYADPLWFAQKGAFIKQENITYFVHFCTHVFNAFHADGINVDMWSIFNSPDGYAFHKYFIGDFPPGIKGDKQLTVTVLKHMYEAHVQVYQSIKAINKDAYVGLLVNIMQVDAWRSWHPLDNFAASIAGTMTSEGMLDFFSTGKLRVKVPFAYAPFMVNVEHVNSDAPHSFDFIGLNYYSHSCVKNMKKMLHPEEIKSKNPNYTIYPEGLYRAIEMVSNRVCKPVEQHTGKHIPVYVTENGVAHDDPTVRKQFFERYLYAINRAIKDGHDVRGYIYWSLMDNYEWGNYNKKYGLVKVDFNDPELTRTIKDDLGTQFFISCMKHKHVICSPSLKNYGF